MNGIRDGALRAGLLTQFFALSEVPGSMSRIASKRRDPCTICTLLTGKMREDVHRESGVESSKC